MAESASRIRLVSASDMFLGRLMPHHVQAIEEIFNFPELFQDSEAQMTISNRSGTITKIDREELAQLKWELHRRPTGKSYESIDHPRRSQEEGREPIENEEFMGLAYKADASAQQNRSSGDFDGQLSNRLPFEETSEVLRPYSINEKFPVLLEEKVGSRTLTVLKGDIFSLESDAIVCCKGGVTGVKEEGASWKLPLLPTTSISGVKISLSPAGKAAYSICILQPPTMWSWKAASRENPVSLDVYLSIKMPKAINSCFEAAESLEATSLAFPLLGTGGGALPLRLAITSLLSALRSCSQKRPPSQVSQVFMVLYDSISVDVFHEISEFSRKPAQLMHNE